MLTERRREATLPGVIVHRPRDRRDLSPVLRQNIRTSNILRLLCDLGAVDPPSVSAAVGHVVTTGMASPVALRTAVEVHARRGRHGVPAFREALDEWVIDGKPVDSVLETAMRKLVTTYKLPPVEFHPIVGGYEVDFRIIDSKIVLECDGWETHGRNKRQFEKDRIRDADLIATREHRRAIYLPRDHADGGEGGGTDPARWSARGLRTCVLGGNIANS